MNQTFSFQRWSLLVAKHWAENRKRYLLSIVAFISLIFVWYVFVMLTDNSNPLAEGLQHITYFFSLFAVGPFYASQFFKQLSSQPKAIDYLMVPASSLEKLACAVLYAVFFFLIVFTAAFYLIDVITVGLANLLHPSYNSSVNAQGIIQKAHVVNVFQIKGNPVNVAYYFLLLFLGIQSVALLGSVYFPQYSYIKTAIAVSLVALTIALFGFYFTSFFMPKGGFNEQLTTYYVFPDKGGKAQIIQLPHWIGKVLKNLFFYAFPPIFWITTYFRLKEKEV
jgi:hypothetical protein